MAAVQLLSMFFLYFYIFTFSILVGGRGVQMRGEGGKAGDGRCQASHRGKHSDQRPPLTVHP